MINWNRVTELCNEIGVDDFDEVVQLFLEEVESVIDRLRTAPVMDTLEADLHFLKGSALNLGFDTFSAHCQTGEAKAATGRADEVDLPEILDCYVESKVCFLSELDDRIAA